MTAPALSGFIPGQRLALPQRSIPLAASIGILGTYPPTQCGLATFSAALGEELDRGSGSVRIVQVVDQPGALQSREVISQLVNGSATSAAAAAAQLDEFDVALIQHEYGIFGGPDGIDVLKVVESLSVPTIIVLHTVLEHPTFNQRQILLRLIRAGSVIVTMTDTARRRLIGIYGADPSKLLVIPHGAVDHRSAAVAHRQNANPLVLTWGLIGPGKGIEWAIDAMAGLRDVGVRYLVAGKTHPKVLQHEGEAYRDALRRRIERRGVADMVTLDDSYLGVSELADLVATADVVLLPYDSREQVTSGVLIEAVAAGRPVVSTAFPHAIELLTEGPGLVVPQRDSASIEAALRRILTEPGLENSLAAKAAQQAPELVWGAVAARYRLIADGLMVAAASVSS